MAIANITNNILTDSGVATSSLQPTITLTTTGTSGAATLISNTLNIPDYGSALTGYVPYTGATGAVDFGVYGLTAFSLYLKKNGTAGSGIIWDAVTSTAIGTTNQVAIAPVSTDGFGFYFGGATKAFYFLASNITTQRIYTMPDANGTIALVGGTGVGTVTSVAALTIGTSGTDLSSTVATSTTTPVITLNVPTASATNRGALSSADWTTFNNKQGTITLTPTGTSGAATLIGATLNIPQYSGGGGSITLSAIGSTPNANAATLTGSVLNLEPASASFGGVVTTGTQTFAGAKTFSASTANQLILGGGTTVASRLIVNRGSDDTNQNLLLGWNSITVQRANVVLASAQTNFDIIQQGSDGSRTPFTINNSGQTTLSGLSFTALNTGGTLFLYNPLSGVNIVLGTNGSSANIIQSRDGTTASWPLSLQPFGGSVGIGTTTIGSKLQVNGNAAIGYSASTAAPTNGLAVSGNVAIGQTTATKPLEIYTTLNSLGGTQLLISTINDSAGIKLACGVTGGNTYEIQATSSGQLIFYDRTNSAYRLTVANGGNVLIGTTDNGGRLVSYSTTAATQIKAAGTAPAITFSNTVLSPTIGGVLGVCTAASQFFTGTASSDMVLANQFSAGDLIFGTNNLARMRVKASGVINITSIPTSSAGLVSGDIYSNAGILTIV
jgi:hypothetical protein